MKERPANDDIVQGFMDGYDLDNPEPTGNRSNSYRHGFMVARIDKGVIQYQGSADHLRRLADKAMESDEPRGC